MARNSCTTAIKPSGATLAARLAGIAVGPSHADVRWPLRVCRRLGTGSCRCSRRRRRHRGLPRPGAAALHARGDAAPAGAVSRYCLGEVLLDILAVCCCPKNPSTSHMLFSARVTVPHAASSSTISRHDWFCWSMQRLQPRQLPPLAAKTALSSSSSNSSCRCSTASQAPCQTASAEVQTLRP